MRSINKYSSKSGNFEERGVLIGMASNLTNVSDNVLNDINNGHLRYLNNLADFIGTNGIVYQNLASVLSVLIPTN